MGTSTPEGRPGDGSSVPDEEWARFLRAAEREGAGGAPKELSADERAARAARAARVAGAARPEGWRTGPAWREIDGRARRRRRLGGVLGVLLAAGLVVVAVRPGLVTDRFAQDTPAGSGGGSTHAAPGTPAEDLPTLKEPFRGSPAAAWDDGAAGIRVPAAKPVGGMSRKDVQHALESTKALLVAANLDPATLRGERPRAALDLLDPLQEDGRVLLEKALADPAPDRDPLWVFSRFDPAEVRPAGDVVKVRGRMTYERGERDGQVLVHADYTFVYPVVKADPGGATEVARTVVRREMTLALYDPGKVRSTPGRLTVVRMYESAGNDDCSRDGEGFLHPEFRSDLVAGEGGGGSGDLVDPYDRDKPLEQLSQECGTVTRT
ncbi:hypothetical protein ACQI4E_16275 [Streptomyces sp. CA-252508]|uniref:hypothetical protein n=1 Tax=Streptomyces sp. CA-252508 TaxID=3418946 RepID=UPI003D913605